MRTDNNPAWISEMSIASNPQPTLCLWLAIVVIGVFGSNLLPRVQGQDEVYKPIPVEFLWQSEPTLDFSWKPDLPVPAIEVTDAQINSEVVRDRMSAAQSVLRAPTSPTLDRRAALESMVQHLRKGESHALVRTEMIAAVCELDDGEHADELWKLAQNDATARLAVERACIRWRKNAPVEMWQKKLRAAATSEQELLVAIDGLGAAGSASDAQLLEELVVDGTRTSSVRLRAAEAIGRVATADQLPLAKRIRQSSAAHAELLAIHVLARSPVETATEFVQDIALHGQLLAQRAAYTWLCDRDPSTAQRLVSEFLKHVDSEVRLLALKQITQANNDQTLKALMAALGDDHPRVRESARELVLTCCNRSADSLKSTIELMEESMKSDHWTVLEQSIRLAVELRQASRCDQLMALIEHERPEVCITACWALRHLAADEAMLGRMLDYVKQITDKLANVDPEMNEIHLQCTAHLLEAFGHRKYEPAKETVVRYVPKNFAMGLITRMTAIWTCGKLWENAENKQLIEQLHSRIADKASMFPESPSLRFAGTLALGWIADRDSRGPLIANDEPKPNPIGYATEWALKRIEARK